MHCTALAGGVEGGGRWMGGGGRGSEGNAAVRWGHPVSAWGDGGHAARRPPPPLHLLCVPKKAVSVFEIIENILDQPIFTRAHALTIPPTHPRTASPYDHPTPPPSPPRPSQLLSDRPRRSRRPRRRPRAPHGAGGSLPQVCPRGRLEGNAAVRTGHAEGTRGLWGSAGCLGDGWEAGGSSRTCALATRVV